MQANVQAAAAIHTANYVLCPPYHNAPVAQSMPPTPHKPSPQPHTGRIFTHTQNLPTSGKHALIHTPARTKKAHLHPDPEGKARVQGLQEQVLPLLRQLADGGQNVEAVIRLVRLLVKLCERSATCGVRALAFA